MKRSNFSIPRAFLLAVLSVITAPVIAADLKVLELVPDDALAVAVIPQFKNFDAKIASVAGRLKLPVPPPIATGLTMLGVKQGIDETRPAALALVPTNERGGAVGLTFLPTSDYDKLISQFAPQNQGNGISQVSIAANKWLAAKMGDYAVLAGETGVDARKALERALAKKPKVSDSIAPLADWISEQDLALAVSHAGIAWAAKTIPALKPDIPALQRISPAEMDTFKSQMAMVEREIAQGGLGLKIDNDATLRFSSRAQLVHDGKISKSAANLPALSDPPMTGLPAGSYFFAFDGVMGGATNDAMSNITFSLLKPVLFGETTNDADLEKLAESLKGLGAGMKSTAMVMAVPQPRTALYGGTYSLQRVDDAQAFFKNYQTRIEEYVRTVKSLHSPVFAGYDAKKSNIDGTEVIEISYSLTKQIEKMKQDAPATAAQVDAMWQLMFGSNREMKMYLTPASKDAVVMVLIDPSHLKTAIEAAKGTGLAADAGVKATVGLLPTGSQWFVVMSPTGLFQFSQTMMQAVAPALPFRLPDFPNTPPIGAAARVTTERFDAQIVVPAEVLDGFGTFMQQIQQRPNR